MPSVTFGPFRLDLGSGDLYRSGIAVRLQPQPSKLLVLLVERAGEVITRDDIRRRMWGTDTFVDFDQSVNFSIRQIRAALHDNASAPCYLETLPRRGYRFIAPVEIVPDEPIGTSLPAGVVGAASRPHRWQRPAILAFAVVIVAGAGASFAFRQARLTVSAAGHSRARQQVELGRFFLNKVTHADTLTALDYFQAGTREDPAYAPAYAALADAYNQLGTVFVAGKPPDNVRLLAIRAATQAIQIDPNLSEAHVSLASAALHELDWERAETSVRRAIELNPQYAPAHEVYATYLIAQRRFGDAISEARRGLDLEPVSLRARHMVAWSLYFDRQYDAAIRELRTILQMDATFARAQWRLGQVLLVAGRYDEALSNLQVAATNTRRAPAAVGLLAMAYGALGQHTEARGIVDELAERSGTQYVPPGASTLAYLGAGDKGRAIDELERVYADRDGYAIYINVDPLMDSLRDEPRFQALCRKLMLGTNLKTTESPGRDRQLARQRRP
jgi:DNA-binding winged helix-turn-helix (wHTH) protein/tetratricopeptide (TPR) repeat protein